MFSTHYYKRTAPNGTQIKPPLPLRPPRLCVKTLPKPARSNGETLATSQNHLALACGFFHCRSPLPLPKPARSKGESLTAIEIRSPRAFLSQIATGLPLYKLPRASARGHRPTNSPALAELRQKNIHPSGFSQIGLKPGQY